MKDYPVTQPSYDRLHESQVPQAWRFPSIFYGEGISSQKFPLTLGVRGHRFHVFNEPWYYAEPEEGHQNHH